VQCLEKKLLGWKQKRFQPNIAICSITNMVEQIATHLDRNLL